MRSKRKAGHLSHPNYKRARPDADTGLIADSSAASYDVPSRPDPTYGQRSAFPGLDDAGDYAGEDGNDDNVHVNGNGDRGNAGGERLFYGPASNGLDYLRMVRVEAKDVPNLLVAPSRHDIAVETTDAAAVSLYDPSPDSDQDARYEDGAFIHAPRAATDTTAPDGIDDDVSGTGHEHRATCDPQVAYYSALIRRFKHLRSVLAASPPSILSADVQSDHSTRAATDGHSRRSVWQPTFCNSAPRTRDINCLTHEDVLRGLQRLETLLASPSNLRQPNMARNLGAWVWALLARCRPASEMGADDTATLRALGKTALWASSRIQAASITAYHDDIESGRTDHTANPLDDRASSEHSADPADAENAAPETSGLDVESSLVNISNISEQHASENTTTTGPHGTGHPDTSQPQPDTEMPAVELEQARARLLADLQQVGQAGSADDSIPTAGPIETGPIEASSILDTKSEPQSELPLSTEHAADSSRAHLLIDMIVTVVGELYGQRDLLAGRTVWIVDRDDDEDVYADGDDDNDVYDDGDGDNMYDDGDGDGDGRGSVHGEGGVEDGAAT